MMGAVKEYLRGDVGEELSDFLRKTKKRFKPPLERLLEKQKKDSNIKAQKIIDYFEKKETK